MLSLDPTPSRPASAQRDPERERLLELAKKSPNEALAAIDSFKEKEFAGEVIKTAIKASIGTNSDDRVSQQVLSMLRDNPTAAWNREVSEALGSLPVLVVGNDFRELKTLPNAEALFTGLSVAWAGSFGERVDEFKDAPWAGKALIAGGKRFESTSAGTVLNNLPRYADQPWAADVVRELLPISNKSITDFADGVMNMKDPELLRQLTERINLSPRETVAALHIIARGDDPEIKRLALESVQRTPESQNKYFGEMFDADPDFARRYLKNVPKESVGEVVLQSPYTLGSTAEGRKLMEETAKNYPMSFFVSLTSHSKENVPKWYFESKEPTIVAALRVSKEHLEDPKGNPMPYEEGLLTGALLPAVVRGDLTESEVRAAAKNPNAATTFRALKRESADGRPEAELALQAQALFTLREFNALHEQPSTVRFKGLEQYTAQERFELLARGGPEAYTSTFNGVYTRLESKMKDERLTGEQIVKAGPPDLFRSFAARAATFGKLDDFIKTIPAAERPALLGDLVSNLVDPSSTLPRVLTASTLLEQKLPPEVSKIFVERIAAEYEKATAANDTVGKAVYGLLANRVVHLELAGSERLTAAAASFSGQYPDHSRLKSESLFDSQGRNVQRHFFYGDSDGKASFQSFIDQYKRDSSSWSVKDAGNFVELTSINGGRSVTIYANKPGKEKEGNDEIDQLLSKNNMEPQVVVHRGHSYHVQSTLERLKPSAALVFLGSCGGAMELAEVAARAPNAQVVATQGEGTMRVNDPLLKFINREIRNGESVEWDKTWKSMAVRFEKEPRFAEYIQPDKNREYALIIALQRLLGDEAKVLNTPQ